MTAWSWHGSRMNNPRVGVVRILNVDKMDIPQLMSCLTYCDIRNIVTSLIYRYNLTRPREIYKTNMNCLFSFGKQDTASSNSSTASEAGDRALPAQWYRSPALYSLERRAIFSKKWMVIIHETRFPNSGDYVQYTVAGYNFFVIKDRKNTIRAFHNVFRHRAYPVMESKSGTASIIACKYHGELRNNTKRYSANISRVVLRPGW